jgi:uncharacterized damage-inducible protein DinB
MNQSQRIADSYRAVTLRDAWYAPALAQVLTQIPPELGVTLPTPGAHSISELLQHLLLWNERVRLTSAAHPLPPWQPEQEWAEPPIPWNELVARWNQSRDQLENKIRNFPHQDLPKQVPGRTYPYEKLLEGIVQHTIYHAGQIAMILSILRRQRNVRDN